MEYKSPRRYILTPRRKRLGKAVARGFNRSVIEECLANEKIKKHLLRKQTQLLQKEMKKMCSHEVNSVLLNKSSKALGRFTWKSLIDELSVNAPLLFHILQGCTMTRTPRNNRIATIGICATILLRFRHRNMNLVQRILSLILYAGHSGKQVHPPPDVLLHDYTCYHNNRCMSVFRSWMWWPVTELQQDWSLL